MALMGHLVKRAKTTKENRDEKNSDKINLIAGGVDFVGGLKSSLSWNNFARRAFSSDRSFGPALHYTNFLEVFSH